MPYDRFLIAPLETGLQTDLRPWLIMDDGFTVLNNAYIFRGRLRKRVGSTLMGSGWSSAVTAPLYSRFSVLVATTDGAGAAGASVPGTKFKPGQQFSIGNEIFTVTANGTPTVMLTTGASTVHTFNTTTGAFVFTGAAANTPVYFYPAEPVMGLTQYQVGDINNQPSYGFDTQFAYVFASGFWQRSDTAGVPTFTGTDSQFFWATNWRGITPNQKSMFVTNFNVTDSMYAFDGTTWTDFSASTIFLSAGNFVKTARIIIPFKNRLLLLNTIEQDSGGGNSKTYVNRCRYSHNGSPFAFNAWLEPKNFVGATPDKIADGAGFIDASTEEAIISAEYIKDRLIVYFERSTWEIVWTGNQIIPFAWQKINTELGSESLLSSVPFDKVVLTIGNTGVHACNGANVERIDDKIPQNIFKIRDGNNGPKRVDGIRDYFTELVYWNYPSSNQRSGQIFPDKMLVYNYKNNSWAINDDCITTFGYFDQQIASTWANNLLTWEQMNTSWDSGTIQSNFRQVIAGNQQGYVFMLRPDVNRNAPVMQITNITASAGGANITAINHTLNVGDFVAIENAQGITGLNLGIYKVSSITSADIFRIANVAFTGTYTGGGSLTRVSNYAIRSKQWNPYVDAGRNVYLAKIDFGVWKTSAGEVTVDYSPSSTNLSILGEGEDTGALLGTGVLETSPYDLMPLEQEQQRLWHSVYFQTEGESVQIFIYMSDAQITNPLIAWAAFELDGMVLSTQATSSRLE